MTTTYIPPDNPADPEAAALDLIVRIPEHVLGSDAPPQAAVQEFTAMLSIEGAFTGMTWNDAKHAAVAIVFDVTNRDDAAEFLRHRAALVTSGEAGEWDDRDAMVRAFNIAAGVLGL